MRYIDDERGESYWDIFSKLTIGQLNYTFTKKGVRRGLHRHQKQDEIFSVLKGEFRFVLDNPTEQKVLKSGDQIFVKTNRWHGIEALTDGIYIYYQNVKYDPNDQETKEWE